MTVRGYRVRVTNVDRSGKRKGPVEWVDVPKAQRVAPGFPGIEPFVSRVVASRASSSWVTISTMSGRTSLSIAKQGDTLLLGLSADVRRSLSEERRIRAFFDARGLAPSSDYLAKNGGVANATRVLDFPVKGAPPQVARIAMDLLREVYRLTERTTLDIRFTER